MMISKLEHQGLATDIENVVTALDEETRKLRECVRSACLGGRHGFMDMEMMRCE